MACLGRQSLCHPLHKILGTQFPDIELQAISNFPKISQIGRKDRNISLLQIAHSGSLAPDQLILNQNSNSGLIVTKEKCLDIIQYPLVIEIILQV